MCLGFWELKMHREEIDSDSGRADAYFRHRDVFHLCERTPRTHLREGYGHCVLQLSNPYQTPLNSHNTLFPCIIVTKRK